MQNVNEKFKQLNNSLRNSQQKIDQSAINQQYNEINYNEDKHHNTLNIKSSI